MRVTAYEVVPAACIGEDDRMKSVSWVQAIGRTSVKHLRQELDAPPGANIAVDDAGDDGYTRV